MVAFVLGSDSHAAQERAVDKPETATVGVVLCETFEEHTLTTTLETAHDALLAVEERVLTDARLWEPRVAEPVGALDCTQRAVGVLVVC